VIIFALFNLPAQTSTAGIRGKCESLVCGRTDQIWGFCHPSLEYNPAYTYSIELYKEYSSSKCIEDQSYGLKMDDELGLWVNNGCSGTFSICIEEDGPDTNNCAVNPCQNGGACTDGVNSHTCACAEGFEGDHCETDTNNCAVNPCQNDGACTDGVNSHTCACAEGFEGDNCETDTNDCAVNPCLNGASCTDRVNSYTCACAEGFGGDNCETATETSCEDLQSSYSCNYWYYWGYCSPDSQYHQYMQKNCVKTCELCGSTGGDGESGGSSNECGNPSVSPISSVSSYIVGGHEATQGSIPWQLSLQHTETSKHFCGGSIINKHWAISAAHCFEGGKNLKEVNVFTAKNTKLVAGAHDRRHSGTSYLVKRIIRHPDYERVEDGKDIVLIEIQGQFIFNTRVKPVCLPSRNYEWQAGGMLMVSGWGSQGLSDESSALSRKLMLAEVPRIDKNRCQQDFDYNKADYVIGNDVICAGVEQGGIDSCQGDSGGPLVGKVNGRFTLVGIVSWGLSCAGYRMPGVYTNVSHYIDWINSVTK